MIFRTKKLNITIILCLSIIFIAIMLNSCSSDREKIEGVWWDRETRYIIRDDYLEYENFIHSDTIYMILYKGTYTVNNGIFSIVWESYWELTSEEYQDFWDKNVGVDKRIYPPNPKIPENPLEEYSYSIYIQDTNRKTLILTNEKSTKEYYTPILSAELHHKDVAVGKWISIDDPVMILDLEDDGTYSITINAALSPNIITQTGTYIIDGTKVLCTNDSGEHLTDTYKMEYIGDDKYIMYLDDMPFYKQK